MLAATQAARERRIAFADAALPRVAAAADHLTEAAPEYAGEASLIMVDAKHYAARKGIPKSGVWSDRNTSNMTV